MKLIKIRYKNKEENNYKDVINCNTICDVELNTNAGSYSIIIHAERLTKFIKFRTKKETEKIFDDVISFLKLEGDCYLFEVTSL